MSLSSQLHNSVTVTRVNNISLMRIFIIIFLRITKNEDIYCIRGNGYKVGDSLADEPHDAVRGILHNLLALLLEIVTLAVREVVADEFGALHAIGHETVALLYRPHGEGHRDTICINGGA